MLLFLVFGQESIQSALISVQASCTEAQKSRYVLLIARLWFVLCLRNGVCVGRFSDLFALAEDVESKTKRKSPSKKKVKVEEGNSDSEESEVSVSARRVFHNIHDSII